MLILSKMKLSKQDKILMAIIAAIFFLLMFTVFTLEADQETTVFLLSTVIFGLQLKYLANRYGTFFSPMLLFLIAFYCFQNGQLLLYSLEVPFNRFYIDYFGVYLPPVFLFSSFSTIIAGFAAMLSATFSFGRYEANKQDTEEVSTNVLTNSYYGLLLTGVVALALLAIKIYHYRQMGYFGVRQFEGTVPRLLTMLEYQYPAFAILILVYQTKNSWKRQLVNYSFILWLITTAFIGDRTTGLAGILTLGLLNIYQNEMSRQSKLFLGLISAVIVLFSQLVSFFRIGLPLNELLSSEYSVLTMFLNEVGFSWFPLAGIISLVPQVEFYQLGGTYFNSLISGLIPSFLDPTGTLSAVTSQALLYEQWQSNYFGQFDFGLGFSLNAEAYMNFGYYGLIAIFVEILVVSHFIGRHLKTCSKWEIYQTFVLLFFWFTLPRRSSYYIWNAIFYTIILMRVYAFKVRWVRR